MHELNASMLSIYLSIYLTINRPTARTQKRMKPRKRKMKWRKIGFVIFDKNQQDYTDYDDAKFYKVNFSTISKCETIEFKQHIHMLLSTPDKIL